VSAKSPWNLAAVLASCIERYVQARAACLTNACKLEQIKHGVAVAVDQKSERDDQASKEAAVYAVCMRASMAWGSAEREVRSLCRVGKDGS
jgi:hypothetical protein